jgi:hypothetical protein
VGQAHAPAEFPAPEPSGESTLPVFHIQSRNSLELARIVGHESQPVMKRNGSNLEIVRAIRLGLRRRSSVMQAFVSGR